MVRNAWCLMLVIGSLSLPVKPVPAASPASQPVSAPAEASGEMLSPATPIPHPVSRDTGYRGLWWSRSRPSPMLRFQLSGGLAFGPMDHGPVAHYAPAVEKTFFVYAGTAETANNADWRQPLRIMIGCYDHRAGTLALPVILADDLPTGAYGCPALSLDADGRLWVFMSILNADYPSTIFRSARPYDIDAWEKVTEMEFSQPQAWYVPGQGFMLVHTRMVGDVPRVHFSTSPDGLSWSKPMVLATFGQGQSCISGRHENKVGVALSQRQAGQPSESRQDLYYLETPDFGKNWQVYPRQKVELPLADAENKALVHNPKQWRAFLRDLDFDRVGNPIVLYLLRHEKRTRPGPDTRIWTTSRWAGRGWETNGALFSDSDYDAGCLDVDKLVWTTLIPSRPGPQPNSSGGEIVRWRTEDQGRSWVPELLTPNSAVNHNHVRRVVDGRPELVALWADGKTWQLSASRLYFADRAGNVYRLPSVMKEASAKPELVWSVPVPQSQPQAPQTQAAAEDSASTKPATSNSEPGSEMLYMQSLPEPCSVSPVP